MTNTTYYQISEVASGPNTGMWEVSTVHGDHIRLLATYRAASLLVAGLLLSRDPAYMRTV